MKTFISFVIFVNVLAGFLNSLSITANHNKDNNVEPLVITFNPPEDGIPDNLHAPTGVPGKS